MRNFLVVFLSMSSTLFATAGEPKLIVQQVNNSDFQQGSTYRLYAEMPSIEWSLHAVWGDQNHPLYIQSTTPFFQHPMGNYNASGQHETLLALDNTLQYDTYITLGYTNHLSNAMWDIGIDFDAFDNSGAGIETNNGAWFLLPQDSKCQPTSNSLIFLGQFTLNGVASGVLNLQGLKSSGEVWKAFDLPFSTNESFVFGCTSENASNYNANATYDDGSCDNNAFVLSSSQLTTTEDSWSIFPNPVRDNLIHLQLYKRDEQIKKFLVEIFDMSGRKIASHDLTKGNWSAPGRVTINQALAPGNYNIVLVRDQISETKQLVVVK